jgi:hypothetical protein
MALKDNPARQFPLRFKTYSEMFDRLTEATARFEELGYQDPANGMEAVRESLSQAWDTIVAAEQGGR